MKMIQKRKLQIKLMYTITNAKIYKANNVTSMERLDSSTLLMVIHSRDIVENSFKGYIAIEHSRMFLVFILIFCFK